MIRTTALGFAASILLASTLAAAQPPPKPIEPNTGAPGDPSGAVVPVGVGSPPQTLPPPRSDNDAQPPVAATTLPTTGVTTQAGVGGTQAYGRAGVLEIGGSAGFNKASGYTQANVSPTIGLFITDNVEMSFILGLNYIATNVGMVDTSATLINALIEPSFHLPFSQTVFGFVGMGAGISKATGVDLGFAIAPRVGMNFLIGRSGILTPAIGITYSTTEAVQTPNGTLLAVTLSYGINLGFTVMF